VDLPDLMFAVVGVGALLASMLPRLLEGRPFSLPLVFLALGLFLGAVPGLPIDASPAGHAAFLQHFTEVVVIIALMGAGLSLDRRVGWRRWRNTWRLLAIGMPLSILCVGVLGMGLLGLAPAAAILLGAVLAPTDPVLAGEVQVGEPTTEELDEETAEDEVRFSLTSEAGLNDALAFPFVYFALALAEKGTDVGSWLPHWFAVDVVYRLGVGVLGGLAVGWILSRLFFSARRETMRLADHREGSVALAATFLAYGVTELLQGYGFLAVFVAAVTIRNSQRFHGYHVVLHQFIEQVERLLTVLVLLLIGAALTDGLLLEARPLDLAVAAVILLVVRPVVGVLSLVGASGTLRERATIGFFGVRGIGSIYYLAYGLTAYDFVEQGRLYAIVALVVAGSVVLHGVTAGPAMRRLDRCREGSRPEGEETAVVAPPASPPELT
jgi:NhaP-type Na+/H+ or K+/H+ antiporter